MRRFFSVSFAILILAISAAGAAPAAHAEFLPEGMACPQGSYWIEAKNQCEYDEFSPAALVSADEAFTQETAATAARIAGDKAAAETVAGGLPADPTGSEGFGKIMTWIMSLFAWLVGVAAVTLDYAVFYTVVTMGEYVKNLSAIGVTWRILRDIGNIMLIFGFLAVGITTILNVDWYGGGKQMLPKMLMAAVFLNFSLFITEAIIDTGNLFATQFYTQIKGGSLPTAESLSGTTILNAVEKDGISNKIMAQLGLQTLYGAARDPDRAKEILKDGNIWIIGFMGIILFIITAFVMFSLAFILIARFVILLFLIILAPIGFVGLAVPQLKSTAKKWWDTLFEQTITAPVLLLCLYIALAVITDVQFLRGFGSAGVSPDWAGTIKSNIGAFAPLLLSFLVAMGLLIAVVIISKKLSAFGASTVMNVANSVKSGATKFAMGSVKFAGRSALGVGRFAVNRTAGRAAHVASQAVLRSDFGQTQAGRLIATGLGKGGKGFKEAKDKSAKTHEEYKNSVAKALEEAHAPTIANAQLKRTNAEEAVKPKLKAENAAKEKKEKAEKETKPLIDEVKRLEEIIKSKGKFDPERIAAEKNLPAAKVAVEAKTKVAEDAFNAAHEATEKAKKEFGLDEAMKEEEAATKVLADAKREAAVAYGENARTAITQNPLSWAVSGPGGSVAGNKIIQDTLKKMSDTNKAIDMLKKAFEKETKTADKSAETSEKLNKAKEDLKDKTEEEAEPNKP